MSDTERFLADVKTNQELQSELQGRVGIPGVVEVANRHGYSVTEADVRAYSAAHQAELSEQELEAVAGGRGSLIVVPIVVIILPV